jgi:hypothetical protein
MRHRLKTRGRTVSFMCPIVLLKIVKSTSGSLSCTPSIFLLAYREYYTKAWWAILSIHPLYLYLFCEENTFWTLTLYELRGQKKIKGKWLKVAAWNCWEMTGDGKRLAGLHYRAHVFPSSFGLLRMTLLLQHPCIHGLYWVWVTRPESVYYYLELEYTG